MAYPFKKKAFSSIRTELCDHSFLSEKYREKVIIFLTLTGRNELQKEELIRLTQKKRRKEYEKRMGKQH